MKEEEKKAMVGRQWAHGGEFIFFIYWALSTGTFSTSVPREDRWISETVSLPATGSRQIT